MEKINSFMVDYLDEKFPKTKKVKKKIDKIDEEKRSIMMGHFSPEVWGVIERGHVEGEEE